MRDWPYTGRLAIAVNDTCADSASTSEKNAALCSVLAELLAHFGTDVYQQFSFTLLVDECGPALSVAGDSNVIDRLFGYAGENYPRLAAEFEQV